MNGELEQHIKAEGSLVQLCEYDLIGNKERHDWYLIDGEFDGEASLRNAIYIPKQPSEQNMLGYEEHPVSPVTLLNMYFQFSKKLNNQEFSQLWRQAFYRKNEEAFQKLLKKEELRHILDEFLQQDHYIPSRLSPSYDLYHGIYPKSRESEQIVFTSYAGYVVGTIIQDKNAKSIFSSISEISLARSKKLTHKVYHVAQNLSELDIGFDQVTLVHHVMEKPDIYVNKKVRLQGYLVRNQENGISNFFLVPAFEYLQLKNWKKYSISVGNQNGMIDKLYGVHDFPAGSLEPNFDFNDTMPMMLAKSMQKPPKDFQISLINVVGTIECNTNEISHLKITNIQSAANPSGRRGFYIIQQHMP